MQIVAAVHRKQENSNMGNGDQKNGLVGDLFVKFLKIVLKSFIHNKELSNAIARVQNSK